MMQNRVRARSTSSVVLLALALSSLSVASGCGRSASVQAESTLPLRRVVVYRNGVGYFERQGHVDEDEVRFRVSQREVGDFLATLAVMERGGSSVRAAAFPMPEERPEGEAAHPEERRTVRLALDGRDVVVVDRGGARRGAAVGEEGQGAEQRCEMSRANDHEATPSSRV